MWTIVLNLLKNPKNLAILILAVAVLGLGVTGAVQKIRIDSLKNTIVENQNEATRILGLATTEKAQCKTTNSDLIGEQSVLQRSIDALSTQVESEQLRVRTCQAEMGDVVDLCSSLETSVSDYAEMVVAPAASGSITVVVDQPLRGGIVNETQSKKAINILNGMFDSK